MSGNLSSLKGCYLYHDYKKSRWIRSGKTSGDGKDACFKGRVNRHKKDSRLKDEMRKHPFYAKYLAKGVENVSVCQGYFDTLTMYSVMV